MKERMISRRTFMRAAGVAAATAAVVGTAPAASAASFWPFTMDLQILATSDTHGKFDPWDYAANKEDTTGRSEEHTSELQSRFDLVCRLLLEKKKKTKYHTLYNTDTRQTTPHKAV